MRQPEPEKKRGGREKRPEGFVPTSARNFDKLPDSALVGIGTVQVLDDCSRATVYRRVDAGLLPKPIKRGATVSFNVGELRRFLCGAEG